MMEFLWRIDRDLFFLINNLPHNLLSDSFFSFFSGVAQWGIIWFAIGLILLVWEKIKDKRGLIALLLSGIFVFITVEIGTKYLIQRPRPEFALEDVIVISDRTVSPSFPSSHSAMAFAAAYILAREHRKWGKWYYLLALLIAFSRIYIGKHYPSDTLIGGISGLFIGWISLKISINVFKTY